MQTFLMTCSIPYIEHIVLINIICNKIGFISEIYFSHIKVMCASS